MGTLFWVIKNTQPKEKRVLTVLIMGAIFIMGINLYIPFVYKDFIALSQKEIALNLIMLFAGLYTLSLILNYIFEYISSLLSYRIEKSFKEKVYVKIYSEKENIIAEKGSSYYSEVISSDAKKASESLNLQSINSIFSIFVAITAIIILGFNDTGSAVISLLYFVLYIYIFLRPSMERNKGKIPGFEEYSKLTEDSRLLVSYVNDTTEGRDDVKATNTKEYEEKAFGKKADEIYKGFKNIWTQELKNFHFPFRFLYFIYYSLIFVWFYISYTVNNKITIDGIFFILTYIGIISSNIEPFMNYLFKNRNYFAPSVNKLKEITECKEEKETVEETINEEIKEIELRNAEFSYGNDKVLNKINLRIKKGEKVALVGRSGEGKTTLIKIITGKETPQNGLALINGKEIKEIKNIYEKIGVLSQNSHIFNRSIKENITMGRDITQEKLSRILKMSGVDSFIKDENAGQNGNSLSGGQRVRVALARIMVSDPEIIILDEPLEGVDKLKEEEIIENIKKYTENKTVIIISHRFSILNMAERIIGIEEGKIILDEEKTKALKDDTLLKKFSDAEFRMTDTGKK
ncbi:MAG: ABC transporter ATP-binding protein [Thermotogae bacterium]|nr:ABC transporter ATP-binding protein [Thermotogota bacterium]